MSIAGDICLFRVGPGHDGLPVGVLSRSDALRVAWCLYPVVLSAVEACADHCGLNVFHGCLNFGVVYGGWGLRQCLRCSLC